MRLLTIKKVIGTSVVVLSLTLALTGCGTPAEDKLFQAIEQASAAENQVPTAFEQLKQLEAKDQQQYDNILNKGERDSTNVQMLISNTEAILQERQQAIDLAKEQLDQAKSELGDLSGSMKKLKDDALKQKTEQIVTAYTKRYESFQSLHARYIELLKAEQSVYDTLKEQDTKLKAVQAAVAQRNQVLQQVEELKNQFNDYTKQFNDMKQDLYAAAGIVVDKVVTTNEKADGSSEG